MKLLPLLLILAIFTGCASNPDKIGAAYVSPFKYKDYDEDQIIMEMDYIGQKVNELYFRLKKEQKNDAAQMGVGMLLFWPALFMLEGGDGPEAAEYARLKGEYEALRQAAVSKKINMNALPPSPEDILEDIKANK